MGRTSIRFNPPPVRLGRAQARRAQEQMLLEAERTSRGAGDFGQREARYASVPIRLRLDKGAATANSQTALSAALPSGRTRRKRGYKPIPRAAEAAGLAPE